jgi:TRAP-type mannitol/chloroaromatic compound transport system permease small subunit
MTIQTLVRFIDRVSDWVGRQFAWFAVPLALLITYEVFCRRILNNPHIWSFEVTTCLYAIQFMMVGGYGLLHNSHVNIDTLYIYLPRRVQAAFDVVSYLVMFFPFVLIMFYAGTDLAIESVAAGDNTVTGLPIIVPVVKTLIPVSSFLLLFQGLAQFLRSLYVCVRGREL